MPTSPEEEIKNWQAYLSTIAYLDGWAFGFVYDFELDQRYVTIKVAGHSVPYVRKFRVDNFTAHGKSRADELIYAWIDCIERDIRNDNLSIDGHYPYSRIKEQDADAQPASD